MFQHHFARRVLFAAVLSSSALVPVAVHADGDQPRPGSFAAIMAVKDPSHFGPHLPAADLPSTYRGPVPGSIAAISSVKDPSRFGPHLLAADTPSLYVPPVPGSIAAVLAAKDPANFGPGLKDCDTAC